MSDINQERIKAIREAWKSERTYVRGGVGTRDWSQSEQREIVAKGRANGYEGHHMKSVKDYPQHAGNPQNIQFLNRSEHINGAHKGNTQNATNGYYDPKTGTMHDFGNRAPQAPQSQALSVPLTQKEQNLAIKREQARQQAAKQAKAELNQAAVNKGIEAARQKAAAKPTGTSTNQSTNKGIASYQNQVNRQSSNTSKNSASELSKVSSASSSQGR